MAERIQRRRQLGWRMPVGSVYVGRPSVYGNPFRIGVPFCGPTIRQANTAREAVDFFRAWLALDTLHPAFYDRELIVAHVRIKAALQRGDLISKDLVCWCPRHLPCHADVLLEIATKEAARV